MSERLLNTRQFAEHIGVCRKTVLRYVAQGKIIPIRLPGGFRFRPAQVELFLSR